MSETYYFEDVTVQATKHGSCTVCGTPANRQREFTSTVHPCNRNDDGTQRTYREVKARVMARAEAWEAAPLVHEKCEAPR